MDVINAQAGQHTIQVAAGSKDADVQLPDGVSFTRISGLRASSAKSTGLDPLDPLLEWADLIHVQNVMNPIALSQATQHNSVVTVQDHRVFCPGPGKTLPNGESCAHLMNDTVCSACLPDPSHREHMLAATTARLSAIRRARRIIVLSEYMAHAIQQAGLQQTVVIPPPVPMGSPKSSAGYGFLMAGRIVRHKAPDLAHTAWRQSGTTHPLRVAGLGSEKSTLTAIDDLGWLSRTELREAMAAARALLFPSRWQEPFGIVGVEALAMGTPVIAVPSGGMQDWCQAGCIQVQSAEEMAEAIRYLDQNPNQAMKLGQAGAQMVEERFSPATVHQKLQSTYSDCTNH